MALEGALSPFVTQMIQQLDVPRWNAHHVVLLNPRLAYATLLLQSLAVRGMVSSKTTRWLPSYVNGEDKILRQSLSILETLESMDAFPEEAALHLTAEQRRFVVLKLYDLMHLEGRPSQSQWAHFHHVRSVLAVDEVDVASLEKIGMFHALDDGDVVWAPQRKNFKFTGVLLDRAMFDAGQVPVSVMEIKKEKPSEMCDAILTSESQIYAAIRYRDEHDQCEALLNAARGYVVRL